MKETDKKRVSNNNQTRRSAKSDKRYNKISDKDGGKNLKGTESVAKVSSSRTDSRKLLSDSRTGRESSEVYENMDVHYMDDVCSSEESSLNSPLRKSVDNEIKLKVDDHSTDIDSDLKEGIEEESDQETTNGSESSSQGDLQTVEDVKTERISPLPKSLPKNDAARNNSSALRVKSDQKTNNVHMRSSKHTPKQVKSLNGGPTNGKARNVNDSPKNMKVHPKPSSDSSEGVDDTPLEEVKEVNILDEASKSARSIESDDEAVDSEKNGVDETEHYEENGEHDDKVASNREIEEMEERIGKLEEELREVAALEIALYSVVPEHGSSAHKVHTPARRLSRLYLHASKYWSQNKRATIARNTVSGLVLIAKSCGNDVSRLTFWMSNTIVLREIISQAFGSSCQSSSLTKMLESNGGAKRGDPKSSSLKWKTSSGGKPAIQQGLKQFIDDWEETRTLTAALEKIEEWIFSRIVESIWWQTLAPNMQSPSDNSTSNKAFGRLLGPALGDQQQGCFSIDLWKNAFQDAFRRLCPIRSGGHECGCLPALARKVMEQCVARLDVAMFNAILRESAHEIPTDPLSDPILDCRVLPIPAGDLSFGSGAQLKNSIGNWSRCLNDLFGVDVEDSVKAGQSSSEDEKQGEEAKCFHLLNELSDLLMLPKDMVIDRAIRMEVCPSIGLSLVKRILCNFSPDEFCPEPVPGAVLEALNAECIIERRFSGESVSSSFPCAAAPVKYTPPSSANVAEAGGNRSLSRIASAIQKKGYTSDEELQELESPLESMVDQLPSAVTAMPNGSNKDATAYRYELLREVWCTT